MNDFFEITELAGGTANVEFAVAVDDGDAGGIIATIFELTQAFNDNRDNLFWADIAHNPAHEKALLD